METKTKKRILISVLVALAALLLAAGAFYAWRAVSFARGMRALTESAGLESTAVSVREKTGLLSLRRALEREQTAHDTRAAALNDRAEEFNSSLLILVNPWNEVPQGYTVQLDTVEGYLVDRRCARALAQMLAELARLFGGKTPQDGLDAFLALRTAAALDNGWLPADEGDLALLAGSVNAQRLGNYPVALTEDDLYEMYRRALWGWR